MAPEGLIWTLSGDQSNKWLQGQAGISANYTSQPFTIIFEGTIGNTYQGTV